MAENEIHNDYKNRINRVFQYIDDNLNSDLSLNTVSEIACFSPFHFHRIFKMITQETLNEYVTRRRVEKSASNLMHRNTGVGEISLKYGFNDISTFTRTFKKFYGVSPMEFRKQNSNKVSKICQLESKNGQKYSDNEKYICVMDNLKEWTKMNAKIEIRRMPKMKLAYLSSIGPQNLGAAYQQLIRWARPKGLVNEQAKMLTIYHDSFKITEPNKVRMSACITLQASIETDLETDSGVGLTSIEEGKFIVGRFEIGLEEFEKSWTGLFIWMNENGYKKADRNPFEMYHNDFNEHPERKCIVDFCIPIE